MQQLAFSFAKGGDGRAVILTPQQERGVARIRDSASEYVIGIDEVGLGAWAGPVVVAAVVLPKSWRHAAVKDSKKLSHSQRLQAWQAHILPTALSYCVLSQPNTAVDAEGVEVVRSRLTEGAALFCRRRYPKAVVVQDGDSPVLVDGDVANTVWMPQADSVITCVSAASILAKITRDLHMREQAKMYPGYDFENNVGYHSERHRKGLEELGVCPLHRCSYKPVKAYERVKSGQSW